MILKINLWPQMVYRNITIVSQNKVKHWAWAAVLSGVP